MTPEQAEVDAAFEIEYARNPGLVAMAQMSGKDVTRMTWTLGFLAGKLSACREVREKLSEPMHGTH
jgi:hypothetical protein